MLATFVHGSVQCSYTLAVWADVAIADLFFKSLLNCTVYPRRIKIDRSKSTDVLRRFCGLTFITREQNWLNAESRFTAGRACKSSAEIGRSSASRALSLDSQKC